MREKLAPWILVADLLGSGLAVVLAYAARNNWQIGTLWYCLEANFFVIASLVLIWTVLSLRMQLDGFKGGWSLPAILSQSAVGVGLLMTALLALAFLARELYSRLQMAYLAIFLFVIFVTIRCLARFLVGSSFGASSMRRVAIFGNGYLARELAAKINRHPEMMWEFVGFIVPSGAELAGQPSQIPTGTLCLATLGTLQLLQERKVHELLVADQPSGPEFQKLVAESQRMGIQISVVPQWYELYLSKTRLIELDGFPILTMEKHKPAKLELVLKRAFDVIVGTVMLVLAAPILCALGALLRVSKGRAWRTETRCGKNGEPFNMYRLNVDRDSLSLSGIEKTLNQLSLTELPQLVNIIRGEMSLVGPRPESIARVKHYSEWQRQRLRVRPGLTGLAQVHGIREQHSSEEKARFDLQYLYDWSIFSDLSLLVQSLWTLAFRPWAPRLKSAVAATTNTAVDVPNLEAIGADSSQPCAD
ncbi:MAG TPA: sugar transferase [Terriglobales bacterium]|nr:sugar transferase [Terriglobales bacterium]